MLKPLAKFTSKNGKEIEIHLPSLERTKALLEFVNRLTKEDTYLSLTGNAKTFEEEENWVKNAILNMKSGRSFMVWAVYGNRIIGSSDVNRGGTRDFHVGKIGLMVDKDFRRDGIGKYILEFILNKAKQMDIKIVALDSFSDNEIAISLYRKMGFKEYGCLPNGLYRQKKYSDRIEMYKKL